MKPAPAPPITLSELEQAVEHIAFECFYFRRYRVLIRAFSFSNPAACQAVTYALLLHARVLVDFFYMPPKPGTDDCCLTHFIGLSSDFKTAFTVPTTPPVWVENVRVSLNKRLAHLTAARWRDKRRDKPPQPNDIDYYYRHFGEVENMIEAFINALPDNLRTPFDRKWQELEKRNSQPTN